jgi:hypothetical protein
VNHNSSRFFQSLGSYAIRDEFRLDFDVVASPAKLKQTGEAVSKP